MNIAHALYGSCPASCGDWGKDNAAGRAFAGRVLAYVVARQAPMVVGHALARLLEQSENRGLYVGFCHVLATSAMCDTAEHRSAA